MCAQRASEDEQECPGSTTASITTITAATGEVMANFTNFRSVNLGHSGKLLRPRGSSQLQNSPIRQTSDR
jgi:hypothetical protein